MNINIGPETVEDLYEAGLVKNVADLYTLEMPDLLRLERWAEKSARNLMAKQQKNPNRYRLNGCCLDWVSVMSARLWQNAWRLHSIRCNNYREASLETLTEVDEIGERIARSVVDYFADENNRVLVARLQEYGLTNDGSRRSAGKPFR